MNHDWIRARLKRLRFYFGWIFAAWVLYAGKTTDAGFQAGIPVIVLGEMLRIWAQGCIEKKVKLAMSGPYAFTRNPLYVSNFLIGLGFVLIFANWWFILLYQIGFFLAYLRTIREEEAFLLKEYGMIYQNYCASVPRFFPALTPYPHRPKDQRFSWKLVWQHGEQVTFLAILLLILGLFLRQTWQEDSAFPAPLDTLWIGLFVLLALTLTVLALGRKFKKSS